MTRPSEAVAGLPAIRSSVVGSVRHMGLARSAQVLRRMNQEGGFDCPSCAWPDPEHRRTAEFCENGSKAVAWEATTRVVDREFFARHPVADLDERSEWWLGQQGRLTEPMVLRPGATHYEPIEWEDAFALIAEHLVGLENPDQAAFYTSGRTSNEAAYLYQAFVRAYGTNNLPDCSNMCHESSGVAMISTLGIGKGAVTVESLEQAELIVIMGQNPGSNAPRMLTHVERAKQNGAVVVAVNPLPEAGLLKFRNPQTARGLVGGGTPIADLHLQVRLGGDKALLQGLGALLLDAEDAAPGTVLDQDFIASSTSGYDEYAAHVRSVDWTAVEQDTGLSRTQLRQLADLFVRSRATTICWAMGLTQHADAVASIREIVNVLLLQGNIGKPGAGPCPVRGHSNVQGDRTMGINDHATPAFLDAIGAEFGFTPRYQPGLNAVGTVQALRDGRIRVFVGLGGNFATATPDTPAVYRGLRSCDLTVQISTKLNRSHTVTGQTALILPVRGRTDTDATASGPQVVTVEDSQGQVRPSIGRLAPPSPKVIGEPTLVARLARHVLGPEHPVPWEQYSQTYATIRDSIARTIPGFTDFNARLAADRRGFLLPHRPRDERRFDTPDGHARFTVSDLQPLRLPDGCLLLQTIRSHDQFNTTVYGPDDRYRGIHGGRRVVLVHPDDLHARGLHDGDVVDLVTEWSDGERRAAGFRCVAYPTAPDCAAAYFPETNVLVPADHVAAESGTPVSKSLVVRLEPTGQGGGSIDAALDDDAIG
ncbi:MAG: FdhF/YdeP family oxidoreductase [Angustibacter sp.]